MFLAYVFSYNQSFVVIRKIVLKTNGENGVLFCCLSVFYNIVSIFDWGKHGRRALEGGFPKMTLKQ